MAQPAKETQAGKRGLSVTFWRNLRQQAGRGRGTEGTGNGKNNQLSIENATIQTPAAFRKEELCTSQTSEDNDINVLPHLQQPDQ